MTDLSRSPPMTASLNTLDEPVLETIKRDLNQIKEKLLYVISPMSRKDKGKGLASWDLYGPLILCLTLSMILALQTKSQSKASIVFALVFILIWLGSGVVTLNALLLKGKISFFQSVCVLGYCVFPLVISAFLCMIMGSYSRILKFSLVVAGFVWSTGSSVGFMESVVPVERKMLGVYPVWLFYLSISWMILLA